TWAASSSPRSIRITRWAGSFRSSGGQLFRRATLSRAGSPPAANRRVAIARPKNDIYVALLALAFGAIVLGCILLAIELGRYNWKVKPEAAQTRPSSAQPAVAR